MLEDFRHSGAIEAPGSSWEVSEGKAGPQRIRKIPGGVSSIPRADHTRELGSEALKGFPDFAGTELCAVAVAAVGVGARPRTTRMLTWTSSARCRASSAGYAQDPGIPW